VSTSRAAFARQLSKLTALAVAPEPFPAAPAEPAPARYAIFAPTSAAAHASLANNNCTCPCCCICTRTCIVPSCTCKCTSSVGVVMPEVGVCQFVQLSRGRSLGERSHASVVKCYCPGPRPHRPARSAEGISLRNA